MGGEEGNQRRGIFFMLNQEVTKQGRRGVMAVRKSKGFMGKGQSRPRLGSPTTQKGEIIEKRGDPGFSKKK